MFVLPYLVQIQNSNTVTKISFVSDSALEGESLTVMISKGIAYLLVLAGLLSVAYIIYGGILLIMSGGKDESKEQAFKTMKHALVGLIITILSFSIINFVGQVLNLELVRYVNFQEIVRMVNQLFA